MVLLGKRKSAHGSDCWAFPGGHLEFGESVEECAARELYEETGLTATKISCGPYTNDIFIEAEKHYITLYAFADTSVGEPEVREPEKCACWEWFKWDTLPAPLFLPIQNLIRQGFSC